MLKVEVRRLFRLIMNDAANVEVDLYPSRSCAFSFVENIQFVCGDIQYPEHY